ncbi:MAG TPA: DNA mismatch repair endonuclease MutL [Bacteroidales bacterium]|jgi:DNA mismatch repair protein MutL|nr:DNA mismatch repair endonuclease MutL [Bacteroidales bacterium]HQH24237.1 DNA mismatch repair endonuclease MutL [Bacteroidales bacterium]HQJ82692.1 DNA mismatch repair endonuclease MutL [Bacteroidales bacterium]
MPDIIKLLPDSVANQIAAGEVIQRPASVVKELMENAVDAGATAINVIIRDSGRTLIRVTDDGSGMSETDARLSFERHATSKISSANDLFSIKTKGFRGEALASIAAVAMVELKTRREDEEVGTMIAINGSRVESQEPCSCPKGSNFSVKNLFYNIPARRKFLKSDNTEMRNIIIEFQKVALTHPDIKFTLLHNDTEVYNLSPANNRQRIIGIFGRQINRELIPLETETTIVNVKGFITKPEFVRRSCRDQFFFVNRRYMRHPYFHKAVMEAYQKIIPPDTIPSYFIFMETDPETIDINIHPTKTEIKFENERAVWQILMASVREALGRFNIAPSIDFENEALVDIPVRTASSPVPEKPLIPVNPLFNPFENEEDASRKPDFISRFGRENVTNWEKLYPAGFRSSGQSVIPGSPEDTERKFFQIKSKYIVCPVKSGLMLIDQKRAHERVLYDRYMESLNRHSPASQTELFPVPIDIDPVDYSLLREIEPELKYLGFIIQFREKNRIIIKGRPSAAVNTDPKDMLDILIAEYKNAPSGPASGAGEKVAAAMASASAIPYGKILFQKEMEDLFDSLFACPSPNYSPGGKPVISIITMEELDRKFR